MRRTVKKATTKAPVKKTATRKTVKKTATPKAPVTKPVTSLVDSLVKASKELLPEKVVKTKAPVNKNALNHRYKTDHKTGKLKGTTTFSVPAQIDKALSLAMRLAYKQGLDFVPISFIVEIGKEQGLTLTMQNRSEVRQIIMQYTEVKDSIATLNNTCTIEGKEYEVVNLQIKPEYRKDVLSCSFHPYL